MAVSGVIGFVGLVVPHMVRLVIGPAHRRLLPASALAGASFVILADVLARTVMRPEELRLGIITAAFGAPFFLYLLLTRTRTRPCSRRQNAMSALALHTFGRGHRRTLAPPRRYPGVACGGCDGVPRPQRFRQDDTFTPSGRTARPQ